MKIDKVVTFSYVSLCETRFGEEYALDLGDLGALVDPKRVKEMVGLHGQDILNHLVECGNR